MRRHDVDGNFARLFNDVGKFSMFKINLSYFSSRARLNLRWSFKEFALKSNMKGFFENFLALSVKPGIVNRTFENRTQSNSIRGLSSIEFGNRTKSNTTLSVGSISEQIEFNRTNRTQSNSIRLIVFD